MSQGQKSWKRRPPLSSRYYGRMRKRRSHIYYDPVSDTMFLVSPHSRKKSFVTILAEGHVWCQVNLRAEGWMRVRSHWVLIDEL